MLQHVELIIFLIIVLFSIGGWIMNAIKKLGESESSSQGGTAGEGRITFDESASSDAPTLDELAARRRQQLQELARRRQQGASGTVTPPPPAGERSEEDDFSERAARAEREAAAERRREQQREEAEHRRQAQAERQREEAARRQHEAQRPTADQRTAAQRRAAAQQRQQAQVRSPITQPPQRPTPPPPPAQRRSSLGTMTGSQIGSVRSTISARSLGTTGLGAGVSMVDATMPDAWAEHEGTHRHVTDAPDAAAAPVGPRLSHADLRRAVMLREIFDKPVSMRDPQRTDPTVGW